LYIGLGLTFIDSKVKTYHSIIFGRDIIIIESTVATRKRVRCVSNFWPFYTEYGY